jgi:hypothetical protein
MATYKFPQFNVEIVNPTIEIDLNTIQDQALNKLLAIDVLLTTDAAKFGVQANNMPYVDTWDDSDIPGMVNIWLTQFEIITE